MRTLREFVREPSSCIELLGEELGMIALTSKGKIVAVVVSPERYEDLTEHQE